MTFRIFNIKNWVTSDYAPAYIDDRNAEKIDWLRAMPFIGIHAGALGVFMVGWSPIAVSAALFLYVLRMFAITAFYHRYFSHRTFKTTRIMQFLFAFLGATAAQRGPLWWASHHRHHHAHADKEGDNHSPSLKGLLWSHTGWFLTRGNFATKHKRIADLNRYPELRWLDRYDIVPPVLLAAILYGIGEWLHAADPDSQTSGMQLLVWGFFVSTVALYHATYSINSIAHRWGRRRFKTTDNSRNNFLLALITLGEGWHNNHHYYPSSARQGFYWYEIDLSYYLLKLLAATGLIRDLKKVPESALAG